MLEQFAKDIEANERLEIEIDRSMFDSIAEQARYNLRQISVEIRRICWASTFVEMARNLARLADDSASKIELEHDLMPTSVLSRWPATYQACSGWSPAIE